MGICPYPTVQHHFLAMVGQAQVSGYSFKNGGGESLVTFMRKSVDFHTWI